MNQQDQTCPLSQQQLIDEYFIEARARLLDLAAFLDRMDRSIERNAEDDFRMVALRQGVQALSASGPGRACAIQMILSDPTIEPREQLDRKSAFGAFKRDRDEVQL